MSKMVEYIRQRKTKDVVTRNYRNQLGNDVIIGDYNNQPRAKIENSGLGKKLRRGLLAGGLLLGTVAAFSGPPAYNNTAEAAIYQREINSERLGERPEAQEARHRGRRWNRPRRQSRPRRWNRPRYRYNRGAGCASR
jgi:hypothetical protein